MKNNAGGSDSSLKVLKHKNRHTVLEYIRTSQSVSVAEIAKATNLSKMTVHNIVDHLVSRALVLLAGKGESTDEGGKKPNLFTFNADNRFIFGVRIGEREIVCALTNLVGEITASHTSVIPAGMTLEAALALIGEAFPILLKRQKITADRCLGAAAGCHGVVNVDTGSCAFAPPLERWGTEAIRDRIQRMLPPHMVVHVDNWMRYHAYGEMKASPEEMSRFFLMGTDYDTISGGLVLEGRPHWGETGLSGEIGHMVVDQTEEVICDCGGVGCFKATSTPMRVEHKAERLRSKWPDSRIFFASEAAKFENIGSAADAGDTLARMLMDESVGHFAVAINNLILACDPGMVVIQGAYTRAGHYFLDQLRQRAASVTMPKLAKAMQIRYSEQSDECSLMGGSYYLADHYFANSVDQMA